METEKMFKMDFPEDPSIQKAVERRRSAETERKARIYNTRFRVMGVDIDALNQQVQEKKDQQNMEKQQDKAFDNLRIFQDEVMLQQDTEERERRAALHTDLTRYWATHQRVEESRDADLKCGLKGACITIPESELGPASMTVFEGEAIGQKQRRKERMKETERDLRAQKEDNERCRLLEKHREMLKGKELMQQDMNHFHLQSLEKAFNTSLRICMDNYNLALAAEQAERLQEQHRREERENRKEIRHILTSDMMTEAVGREVGGGSPSRVLVDKWKGMSSEQLSAIRREREEQCLQKQRQRDAEKVQKAAWEFEQLELSREAEKEEKREEEQRREWRIRTDQYNMRLAREQQEHQEYLNKKLYTNKPTKDYFDQFNTSSR